jgi:hypothetical protein
MCGVAAGAAAVAAAIASCYASANSCISLKYQCWRGSFGVLGLGYMWLGCNYSIQEFAFGGQGRGRATTYCYYKL